MSTTQWPKSNFVVITAHFLPLIKNACWAVLLGTILKQAFFIERGKCTVLTTKLAIMRQSSNTATDIAEGKPIAKNHYSTPRRLRCRLRGDFSRQI